MAAKTIVLAVVLAVCPLSARGAANDGWWTRDKVSHYSVSLVLAIEGYELGAAFSPRPVVRVATAAGLALTAGAAKEISDRRGRGDFSRRDMIGNALGTATGLLVAWSIDRWLLR